MSIKILDAGTVGRIAAGEVVERPASVIKELFENALDAGATAITVEIRGGGIESLRVTDNGCGIAPEEVRLAFQNHATSKLRSAEQLSDIRTMGFRGEALPSIASVAKVTCTTRVRGAQTGVKVCVEGGQFGALEEIGCPEGTTIVARELFYNTPARLTFLKKPAYEAGVVADAVTKLLLGNPTVSVRFINGGKTLFHSFGDGNLRHAALAVYGKDLAEKLTQIDQAEGGTALKGLIGDGDCARPTRSQQSFFINGRVVRCQLLTQALETACRGRVTIGMHPISILNLTLPPQVVDVNVHPNKLEVRFRDEPSMRMTLDILLAKAFAGEKLLDLDAAARPEAPAIKRATLHIERAQSAETAELPTGFYRPDTVSPQLVEQLALPADALDAPLSPATAGEFVLQEQPFDARKPTIRLPDGFQMEAGFVRFKDQEQTDVSNLASNKTEVCFVGQKEMPEVLLKQTEVSDGTSNQTEVCDNVQEQTMVSYQSHPTSDAPPAPDPPSYRLIGVAFDTYLLLETGDKLLLIDQHAAHERILYEKFSKMLTLGNASQQLLTPLIVPVSPKELAQIEDAQDLLTSAGFAVEAFGERELAVRAVPFVLGQADLRPLFLKLLDRLDQLKYATVERKRSEIIQMSCKHAVKGGDKLTHDEIIQLIETMRTTDAPATCPHGRPVVRSLSKNELERMFKRQQ
ncbi:MAG: DNA mismatch repair endonuclease MutL [Clostridia bacterium]